MKKNIIPLHKQIGNSKTSDDNLLGRYKMLNYFKVMIDQERRDISFQTYLTAMQKIKIKDKKIEF